MSNWKQIRIPFLAIIFTAVVLVLVRVILVTVFDTKPKNNSKLLYFPLQIVALIEEN